MPYSLRLVRLTSRISTSTTTSARCLSITATMRSAAATLSGASLMVSALAPGRGATRRAPSTMRSRSIVSLRSAFDRKNVFTICCSYSRRLVGRVGDDVEHARVGHAVEGVAHGGQRVERLLEAHVAQVEA